MRGNNVLGLIFSNVHEENIRDLTENRTMGSVPFGGRYRLIDFPISNMVNSGISKVGVITKGNYQSLMDHLGSGKAWNLSRKREGLFILPPFGAESGVANSRIESLSSIRTFLQDSKEEYVLLTDSDTVCNIDYSDVLAFHLKNSSDITVVCRFGRLPDRISDPAVYSVAEDGSVRDMLVNPRIDGECVYGIGMMMIRRELLLRLVADCVSRNLYNFKRNLIQRNLPQYRVFAYRFREFVQTICSEQAYFSANMELTRPEIREELFHAGRPIYTKVRDDMPARYGLGASVSNSLVADGCVIEGEVKNSILFRGVRIGEGTVVENCVVLQDAEIRRNCHLNYVIADKDVVIKNDRSLIGFESYPVFIAKGSLV